MKILVLSYPYHGAYGLCSSIAGGLNYSFIDDPMDLEWHGATQFAGQHDPDTGIIEKVEYQNPRPYIFNNDIPDNSIFLHYVKWHNLPGNKSEEEFLGEWVDKFDRIIALRSNNLEKNWKRWCAWKNQPHENNSHWVRHLKLNCDFYDYKDSYYDQTCVDKITDADTFLESYINTNSNVVSSIIQNMQKQEATENNKDYDDITSELEKWDIGLGFIGYKNETWHHAAIHAELNAWTGRY